MGTKTMRLSGLIDGEHRAKKVFCKKGFYWWWWGPCAFNFLSLPPLEHIFKFKKIYMSWAGHIFCLNSKLIA